MARGKVDNCMLGNLNFQTIVDGEKRKRSITSRVDR
jgi:hypothetical protein